jgi:RNase adaptor protein for sRNA GlmZ degradation
MVGTTITLRSFSYRSGRPEKSGLVFDVRHLQGPCKKSRSRYTGADLCLQNELFNDSSFSDYYDGILSAVTQEIDMNGLKDIVVLVGCDMGKHRSVAIVEKLAKEKFPLHVSSQIIVEHVGLTGNSVKSKQRKKSKARDAKYGILHCDSSC